VIYPTLDLLQDQGLISVEDENGRKKIAITAEGKQLHAENQEQLAHIQTGCRRAWSAVNCVKIRR
jgi:DNA-binding PadR family transcriptional regulator